MSNRLLLVGLLTLFVGGCATAGYAPEELSGSTEGGRIAATVEPADRCTLKTSTAGTIHFLECR